MGHKKVVIYSGYGKGKSSAAIGMAIREAANGKRSVLIQFMKGDIPEVEFLRKLEPEIKMFRFEKSEADFRQLSEEKQREETQNIRNGINFAKKVLCTGECDLLILDEVLGLLEYEILTADDLKMLIDAGNSDTTIVMTGIHVCDEVRDLADEILEISAVK